MEVQEYRPVYRELTCILTENEKRTYAEELAKLTQELSELEDAKKEISSRYKSKIDTCVSQSRMIARKVSTSKEERQVECHWVFDYKEGIKRLFRKDTGEEIDAKALTIEERQQKLDFDKEHGEGEKDIEAVEDKAVTEGPATTEGFECQDCREKKRKKACGEACTK